MHNLIHSKKLTYLLPLILLLILFGNPFFIVKSGETGLVSTFGKVSEQYRSEGLNFVIPLVQKPLIYSNRTQAKTFSTEAYSSDLQTMKVELKVLFNLPAKNVYTLATKYRGDVVNEFLRPRVEDEIKNVTSKYKAEEFVKSRQEVRPQVIEGLKASLANILNISDLSITNIELSPELEQAIESKQVEEQKAFQKKYELEKEKVNAEIKVVKATADATAIKIKANAITSNPRIIDLEAVKKWDGKMPATYVSGGGAKTFLPLK